MAKRTVVKTEPKNLLCNFRAPDLAHFEIWQEYKKWCQDHGLDNCHLVLSWCDAHLKAMKGIPSKTSIITPEQIINQQNQFNLYYQVQKPRREPIQMNCAKPGFQRTINSMAYEAYVMERARALNRSFSFRDFMELGHNSFRKIILRLKKKGKIVPLPQRTNPRFYVLAERLEDYPT